MRARACGLHDGRHKDVEIKNQYMLDNMGRLELKLKRVQKEECLHQDTVHCTELGAMAHNLMNCDADALLWPDILYESSNRFGPRRIQRRHGGREWGINWLVQYEKVSLILFMKDKKYFFLIKTTETLNQYEQLMNVPRWQMYDSPIFPTLVIVDTECHTSWIVE